MEMAMSAAPSATRVGASYPQYVFRAAAISAFTSRITQQLIGRATELALLSERCTLYLKMSLPLWAQEWKAKVVRPAVAVSQCDRALAER
jgi:hypothetical protein